jgi:hypothetical protein
MRIFLFFLFISNVLYGQKKTYSIYETENGMGIQITQNNIRKPVTSKEYEYIDPMFTGSFNTSDFSKIYVRFKENGKMGILNIKGKEIFPAIYDTIQILMRYVDEATLMHKNFSFSNHKIRFG